MNEHYQTEKNMRYLREYKNIKVKLDAIQNTNFECRKTYEAAYRIMSTFPRLLEKEYLKDNKTSFILKDPKLFFGYKLGNSIYQDQLLVDLLTELLKPFGFKATTQRYIDDPTTQIRAVEIET